MSEPESDNIDKTTPAEAPKAVTESDKAKVADDNVKKEGEGEKEGKPAEDSDDAAPPADTAADGVKEEGKPAGAEATTEEKPVESGGEVKSMMSPKELDDEAPKTFPQVVSSA